MISRTQTRISYSLLFVAFNGWLLNGCAYNESGTADSGQQLKQNKIIEATYGPLIGTYEGSLSVNSGVNPRGGSQVVPAKMVIYFDTAGMTNPDGTPGSRLVPRAYLGLMGTWGERYVMRVEGYTRERSQVSFYTLEDKVLANEVQSSTLLFSGSSLQGEVRSISGPIGILSLELKSREVSVPQESERERYDRLIEATYGPMRGTYRGKLNVPETSDSAAQSVPVDMVVYITTESATNPDGTPGFRKAAQAFFRIEGTWLQSYILSMNGYAKEGEVFSLESGATDPGRVKGMVLQRSRETRLEGEVKSIAGFMGTVVMEKVSDATGVPRDVLRDQQERVKAYYDSIAGVYSGSIQAPGGRVPVSVEITVHEAAGTYILKAFYRRLDVPDVIDLVMDVNVFRLESPLRLSMSGRGNLNYFVSIEVRLVGRKLSGKLSTIKGPQGPIELIKQ